MNIPDSVKQAYRDNSIHKNIMLEFPFLGITITNSQIHQESLEVTESLMEGDRIEFVGCIACSFRIKVNNIKENLKGEMFEAFIWIGDDERNRIRIFSGVVDSVKMESNKRNKEIIAYDELYTLGDVNVADWYNNLTFPITLKNFRDSLCQRVGIIQEQTTLPNDGLSIEKRFAPKNLSALTVLKSICQINATFGIINRRGFFEYRTPAWNIVDVPYPSTTLYPSINLFPGVVNQVRGGSSVEAEDFAFYRKVDYEEFSVKPVDKVIIRQNSDDDGVSYGSGTNKYIIQGNMFTKGLDSTTLRSIAKKVYKNVSGIEFAPFESSNNGLPWIECGIDAVSYMVYNYDYDPNRRAVGDNEKFIRKDFYVFNRTLSGVQALKDSYRVSGDEEQKEFITDLNANIEEIQEKQEDTYTKEELDTTFEDYDTQFEDFSDQIETINETISNDMPVLVKVSVLPSTQEQQAHPNYWYFLEQ